MTWPEVASDAIKIVVPAAIAAGGAIWAVHVSRSTELTKDARRSLEQIADAFEEGHSNIAEFLSLFWTYWKLGQSEGLEGARQRYGKSICDYADIYTKSIGSLSMMIGRARMLGLDDLAAIMERHAALKHSAIEIAASGKIPSNEEIERLHDICAKLEEERAKLHAALSRAF